MHQEQTLQNLYHEHLLATHQREIGTRTLALSAAASAIERAMVGTGNEVDTSKRTTITLSVDGVTRPPFTREAGQTEFQDPMSEPNDVVRSKRDHWQTVRDENLVAGAEHYGAHQAEYHDQAVNDARQAGIDIVEQQQ